MAGIPWRVSRTSVSVFTNTFLNAKCGRNFKRQYLTHVCGHNKSTSFVSPYLSRRCYATSTSNPGPKPEKSSILKQMLEVQGGAPDKTTLLKQFQEEQARDEEEARKRREQQWIKTKRGLIVIGSAVVVGFGYVLYDIGSARVDEEGNVIKDEFSHLSLPEQYLRRIWKEVNYYMKLFGEPSRDKLLPDPLTYPYIQPPYTVVLEFTDLLVHPDWTYQTGWRFKKRPGVDQFLEQIAPPLFEVVVYTAEPGMTVFPILDALDPNGYIMYRLVRDATHFIDGHHVKALDHLNRDLSKVIVVDWNSESVKMHPRNALLVPRWTGNDDDTALIDLAAFLKTIATNKVDDVREVLDYYQQFDDPISAFRENQKKVLEQLEQSEKERKESSGGLAQRWRPTFLNKPKL